MRPTYPVTELLGDGIGPELSRAVHRLAEALPVRLEFVPVDFRLENRRARGKALYDEAIESIAATGVALKHPTTTAEESPNAILRRRLDLSVIHRPVYTIPGVPTNFRRELDLDIVRIATGGTYDDPGRMIGEDGAVSLRIVERKPVSQAARYAFNLARKTGKRVTSSSKYTIQRATDGLFEQVTKEVAGQFPEVPHSVELFDALLGKVIMAPEKFQIVLVLNEYGDFLSDMACGLAGSLGIGASANLGFDAAAVVRVALFDAAHGTAPDIAGKGLANPDRHLPGPVAVALPARRDRRRARGQERHARTCCARACAPATSAARSRPTASPRPSRPRSGVTIRSSAQAGRSGRSYLIHDVADGVRSRSSPARFSPSRWTNHHHTSPSPPILTDATPGARYYFEIPAEFFSPGATGTWGENFRIFPIGAFKVLQTWTILLVEERETKGEGFRGG